jgi:hypothetical protein
MIITPVTFDFVDKTTSGGADCALHPGVQFGPFDFFFNETKSTSLGQFTVDVGTDSLIIDNTLSDGDQVRITSAGDVPGGLDSGTYYFARNPTSTGLQLSLTNGGPAVSILDEGSGALQLIKRGVPLDLTGWEAWAWGKQKREDADTAILIDFAPVIMTPETNGRVQIVVDDADSFTLRQNPTAFWDLIMSDPSGERFGAYVRGRLAITYLVTHPAFA